MPVSYVQTAGLGCDCVPVEVNSSLQTKVFDAMLGEKVSVVTVLDNPAETAIALTVRFDATRNGAWYCCDEVVGALSSTV